MKKLWDEFLYRIGYKNRPVDEIQWDILGDYTIEEALLLAQVISNHAIVHDGPIYLRFEYTRLYMATNRKLTIEHDILKEFLTLCALITKEKEKAIDEEVNAKHVSEIEDSTSIEETKSDAITAVEDSIVYEDGEYHLYLYNRNTPSSVGIVDKSVIDIELPIKSITILLPHLHCRWGLTRYDIRQFDNSKIRLDSLGPWSITVTLNENCSDLDQLFHKSKQYNDDYRFLRLRRDHKEIKRVDDMRAFSFSWKTEKSFTIFEHCTFDHKETDTENAYVFSCFKVYTEKKEK